MFLSLKVVQTVWAISLLLFFVFFVVKGNDFSVLMAMIPGALPVFETA